MGAPLFLVPTIWRGVIRYKALVLTETVERPPERAEGPPQCWRHYLVRRYSPKALSLENVFGQKRRHRDIGQVDGVADPKVHGHAANNISLLAAPAPFL